MDRRAENFVVNRLIEGIYINLIEITGSKSQLVYRPLPQDDPTRRQPDITLAKKHFDWEPKIALREGLEKTIDWFKTIDPEQYRPPTPNY